MIKPGNDNQARLSVMSFNVGGSFSRQSEAYEWTQRSRAVAMMLRDHAADVVGFQEVQAGNLDVLREHLPDHDAYLGRETVERLPSIRSTYNPIFWRRDTLTLLEGSSLYLSRSPETWSKDWDAEAVRGATWVLLAHQGSGHKTIHGNAHLDHRGAIARLESSRLIVQRSLTLRDRAKCPVVLTGDFNSRAWVPAGENKQDYPNPVLPEFLPEGGTIHRCYTSSGFEDAYLRSGHENGLDTNTYHDFLGTVFPPVALRIDWILYESSFARMQVERFEVVVDEYSGVYPSDHYPIKATFYFGS